MKTLIEFNRAQLKTAAASVKFTKVSLGSVTSPPELAGNSAATLDSLVELFQTATIQKPLLDWQVPPNWSHQQAQLGTSVDGVTFLLERFRTCYRRGQWRLTVEVCGGHHHNDWGCFDDADQPMRYYHNEIVAKAEAEAIAAVLLADRMERGSIEGWVKS